jgi:hypothetical protein
MTEETDAFAKMREATNKLGRILRAMAPERLQRMQPDVRDAAIANMQAALQELMQAREAWLAHVEQR